MLFPYSLETDRMQKMKKGVTNTGWLTNLHRKLAQTPPTLSENLYFLIRVFFEGVGGDPVKCAKNVIK